MRARPGNVMPVPQQAAEDAQPAAAPDRKQDGILLLAVLLLVVAGVLGFGGIAGAAAGIAKILFFVFLVLFLGSLLLGGFRRPVR